MSLEPKNLTYVTKLLYEAFGKYGSKNMQATYLKMWEVINFSLVWTIASAAYIFMTLFIPGSLGFVLGLLMSWTLLYGQVVGPLAYIWGFKVRPLKNKQKVKSKKTMERC